MLCYLLFIVVVFLVKSLSLSLGLPSSWLKALHLSNKSKYSKKYVIEVELKCVTYFLAIQRLFCFKGI